MNKNYKRVQILALALTLLLTSAYFAYGQRNQRGTAATQAAPQWIEESFRSSRYPHAMWYSGFAQESVARGADAAEALKRVERQAQNRMAEGITVQIASVSVTENGSVRVRDAGGNVSETIKRDYNQIIEASTNAEVVKAEVQTYHDQAKNMVYAIAVVKKSDLAEYYRSRIEYHLQRVQNDVALAKQYVEQGRKGSALERLAEGRKDIAEGTKYHRPLGAVDASALPRLVNRTAELEREISAMEVTLREATAVFVVGRETIGGQEVRRLASALQARFTQNRCRVANTAEEAGFILEVEANDCNATQSGRFHFCYACVRAELKDAKTGRSEGVINFTGPKESWTESRRACENAFDKALDTLWNSMRNTEACK